MKKIYTITFHRANNYGAMLQAYALQKFLSTRYDTEILNYNNKSISDSSKIIGTHNTNITKLIKDIYNIIPNAKRVISFNKFRRKLRITSKEYNANDLMNAYPEASSYIVGSDQVWNPDITEGIDPIYTLTFVNNGTKKISYAASCGSAKLISDNSSKYAEFISKFDKVSVREDATRSELLKISKNKINVVLDPVFLVDKYEWGAMASASQNLKKDGIDEEYIFAYCVGNGNKLFYDTLNRLVKITGLQVVYFDRRDRGNKIHSRKKSMYHVGPDGFICLLNDAKYVVTTSFHGVALSLILNKKIFITPSTYPERIMSVLRIANLEELIVKDAEKDVDRIYNYNVDWNGINKALEAAKIGSQRWLIDAIEK